MTAAWSNGKGEEGGKRPYGGGQSKVDCSRGRDRGGGRQREVDEGVAVVDKLSPEKKKTTSLPMRGGASELKRIELDGLQTVRTVPGTFMRPGLSGMNMNTDNVNDQVRTAWTHARSASANPCASSILVPPPGSRAPLLPRLSRGNISDSEIPVLILSLRTVTLCLWRLQRVYMHKIV